MGRFPRLSENELDALTDGRTPSGHEELAELASFLRDTAIVLEEAPDEATAQRHLAAMADASRLLADGDKVVAAAEPTQTPRRKLMKRKLLVALAAGLLFALTAFGSVAYAGDLPDPIQSGVADIADTVGLSLPGNENDEDDGPVSDVDDGAQGDQDDGAVNDRDDAAENDRDDAAQSDLDDAAQNDRDDGAQDDSSDSAQNDTDNAAKNDRDDGAQSDSDDSAQSDKNDAAQNDGDDATQNQHEDPVTNSDQGGDSSGGNQSDDGAEGDGDN